MDTDKLMLIWPARNEPTVFYVLKRKKKRFTCVSMQITVTKEATSVLQQIHYAQSGVF